MALNDAVCYLTFDDVDLSGSNPLDVSSNSKDGTTTGATTGVTGKINEGFSFDGTNDKVSVLNPYDINSGDVSVSIWVNPTDLLNSYVIWGNRVNFSGTNNKIGIYVASTTGKIVINTKDSSASNYTSTASISSGSWSNIIVTRSGASGVIYINGVKETFTSASGDISPNENWILAEISGLGSDFNGSMDEFGVWDRQISDSEASDLYNSGNGFNPYATSGYSNKVNGVTPSKVNGIAVANISKVNGI